MSAVLTHNAYGKSQIRLTRVARHTDRHELQEVTVDIRLEGDFEASYLQGDNRAIIATDSMKNMVYVLACEQPLGEIESFGLALANLLLDSYPHVRSATVRLAELPWQRMVIDGREHPHAFVGGGSERRTSTVERTRQGVRIESGIDGLLLLKTTDSAFRDFLRDRYATLPDADDRIFATMLQASWLCGAIVSDWSHCHQLIRRTLLAVFARHRSLAVQQTLHAMGEAALEACPAIEEITLTMPNRHRLLVNLQQFGLDNPNEVFVTTDEPFGLITGTLRRG